MYIKTIIISSAEKLQLNEIIKRLFFLLNNLQKTINEYKMLKKLTFCQAPQCLTIQKTI